MIYVNLFLSRKTIVHLFTRTIRTKDSEIWLSESLYESGMQKANIFYNDA